MPLRFVIVCDLLEALDRISSRDPPLLQKDAQKASRDVVESWFRTNRRTIDCEADGLALLSTLLPEKRTDRVYGLQVKSLEKIVARALSLPNSRRVDLERWRFPGAGDLADCVERVQKQAEMAQQTRANEVTVEEIDETLSIIASQSRFSSPELRSSASRGVRYDLNGLFATVFLRLQSRESKWFIRLILKNYEPVVVPERLVYSSYHSLLPIFLKVQAELPAALRLLRGLVTSAQGDIAGQGQVQMLNTLINIKPVIGTKIGRQPFFKSRSIKHTIEMARNRRMSVEKKYDGEYCQIHIDLSKSRDEQIKIFSKSGKDSTRDRVKLHGVLKESLRLNRKDCQISHQCVLEGELLVFSDKDNRILEYHKIRKHVPRSGSCIGTDKDSQTHESEHLMVVIFDILLWDEASMLNMKHCERMKILERVVHRIPGRAELVERQVIRFSERSAAAQLRNAFAQCISSNGEGLVLKPTDEPYFSYEDSPDFQSCCIKMKRGYIGGFGDVGDFAVVGASYDATKAKTYGIPGLQWTDFYVACLENEESVRRFKSKPQFVVVAIVSPNREILKSISRQSKQATLRSTNCDSFQMRIEPGVAGGKMPSTIFDVPFVFDIRCFGFDKEANTSFWTMRFPQVSKVHFDRSYEDAVGYSELQDMAEMERPTSDNADDQKELQWIKRLEALEPHQIAIEASTQRTSASPSWRGRESQRRIGTGEEFSIREDNPNDDDAAESKQPISRDTRFEDFNTSIGSRSVVKHKKGSNSPGSTKPSKRRRLSPYTPCLSRYSTRASTCRGSISEAMGREPISPLSDITNSSITSKYREDDENSNIRAADQAIQTTPTRSFGNSVPIGSVPKGLDSESSDENDSETIVVHRNSSCRLAGTRCPLARITFTLAPCISKMPWLTENLLPVHGAAFNPKPGTWLDGLTAPLPFNHAEKRDRKVVLVESNRKKETMRALRQIEQLNLKRPSGKKAWVEVYDWRLLEYVDQLERSLDTKGASWRSYWVGAV